MNDYYYKYLKYKIKYNNLKNLIGGNEDKINDITNCNNICPIIDKTYKLYDIGCNGIKEVLPIKTKLAAFMSTPFNIVSKKFTKDICIKKLDRNNSKEKIINFIKEYKIDLGLYPPRKIIDNYNTETYEIGTYENNIKEFHKNITYDITNNTITNFNKYLTHIKSVLNYDSLNDFFGRDIYLDEKYTIEMQQYLNKQDVILSPACSKISLFNTVADAKQTWIKGSKFSLHRLLNIGKKNKKIDFINTELIDNINKNLEISINIYNLFNINQSSISKIVPSCKIIISRLAPQDYHRVHVPLYGNIIYIDEIKGHYRSVQPIVVNGKFDVYDVNRRTNIWMYNEKIGLFIVCLIGAACVGSIKLLKKNFNSINEPKDISYINNFLFNGNKYSDLSKDDPIENQDSDLSKDYLIENQDNDLSKDDSIENQDSEKDINLTQQSLIQNGGFLNFKKNGINKQENNIHEQEKAKKYFNKKKINSNVNENIKDSILNLGEQIGVYEFGGSTVVIVIPDTTNKVQLCTKMLDLSKKGKETLVYPGQYIGNII